MFKRLVIFALILGTSFCFIVFFIGFLSDKQLEPEKSNAVSSAEIIVEDPAINDQTDLPKTNKGNSPSNLKQLTLSEIEEELNKISQQIALLSEQINNLIPLKEVAGAETEFIEASSTLIQASSTEILAAETIKKETALCSTNSGFLAQRSQVIINELAWAGAPDSAGDEWIELKNVSNQEIDLAGWQLVSSDAKIKIFFKAGEKLPAGSFYLLKRTDENTLPGLLSDKIYSGGLKNNGESLYLFDQNCYFQDVLEFFNGWPAGDNSSKRTMERKADFFWQTSANIGGTPRGENSFGYFPDYSIVSTPITAEPPKACSQIGFSFATLAPVIINEVAWMGNSSSSANEWIELKNIATSVISLAGWQLLGQNADTGKNNIEIFFGQKELAANSFYLLERSDDDSILEVAMDEKYTGALNDSNFVLRLFDQNCQLLDEVLVSSFWPAGQKDPEKRTAERGIDLFWHDSWATTSFSGLFGTPKVENSQLFLTPTSSEDTTTDATTTAPLPEPESDPESAATSTESLLVAINEIAWMGSTSSAADEWIELYNNTTEAIDLAGWKITAEDGNPIIDFPTSTILILSGDFFLLERTDDNSAGPAADLIYSGKEALGNDGENLLLLDAEGNLIDSLASSDKWFAGDNATKQTMERINPVFSGSDASNWVLSKNSSGTPKAKNSILDP